MTTAHIVCADPTDTGRTRDVLDARADPEKARELGEGIAG